jgi:hypothetical protein
MKPTTLTYVVFSLLLSAVTAWVGAKLYRTFRAQQVEILELTVQRDSLAARAYRADRRYSDLLLQHNHYRIHTFNTQLDEISRTAAADSLLVHFPDFRVLPGKK